MPAQRHTADLPASCKGVCRQSCCDAIEQVTPAALAHAGHTAETGGDMHAPPREERAARSLSRSLLVLRLTLASCLLARHVITMSMRHSC